MKKLLCVMIVFLMALLVTGCDNASNISTTPTTESTRPVATTSVQATPEHSDINTSSNETCTTENNATDQDQDYNPTIFEEEAWLLINVEAVVHSIVWDGHFLEAEEVGCLTDIDGWDYNPTSQDSCRWRFHDEGGIGHCTYDANGNILTKTWEYSEYSQRIDCSYDESGNRLFREEKIYRDGVLKEHNTSLFTYDQNGNILTHECVRQINDTTASSTDRYEYGYDGENRLIRMQVERVSTLPSGEKVDRGKLIIEQLYYEDGTLKSYRKERDGFVEEEIEYSENGTKVSRKYLDSWKGMIEVNYIQYNEQGDLVRYLRTFALSGETEEFTNQYAYDSNGRRIEYISPSGKRITYEYDADGKLISETEYDSDIFSCQEDMLYYDTGTIKQRKRTTEDGERIWNYDIHGNLVEFVVSNSKVSFTVYYEYERRRIH